MKFKITAEDVRAERERSGRGMMECKRSFEKREILQLIDSAATVAELKDILRWLVTDRGGE